MYCQFGVALVRITGLMLKFLRNKKVQKRIYILLALFIIPAFMLWGVMLTGKDSESAGTLGVIQGKKISLQDYLTSYKAVQHEITLRYGESSKELVKRLNIKGEAWDRLLLLHYARKQNIKASDQEVVGWLVSQPLFSRKGEFDSNFYKLYVTRYLRMDTREFEEEVRQLLSIDKIRDRLASQIHLKDSEIDKLVQKMHRKKEERENIKNVVLARKSAKRMRALLESLRNELKINLDTMRKLFAEEEE